MPPDKKKITKSSFLVTKWLYLGSEAENKKTEGTFFSPTFDFRHFLFFDMKLNLEWRFLSKTRTHGIQ